MTKPAAQARFEGSWADMETMGQIVYLRLDGGKAIFGNGPNSTDMYDAEVDGSHDPVVITLRDAGEVKRRVIVGITDSSHMRLAWTDSYDAAAVAPADFEGKGITVVEMRRVSDDLAYRIESDRNEREESARRALWSAGRL